jgi:hypothetical protein
MLDLSRKNINLVPVMRSCWFKAVLQTSASAKYRRGSENENIGNIRENIGKCRKNEKQYCKNENIGKHRRP